MTFNAELVKWRNGRCQKQVNDILGVSLETYKKWEQGRAEPTELAKEGIRLRMAASDARVSVEVYRLRYLSIIKQVADEIRARK